MLVKVFVERMVEVLSEFLESSTIHGLFYISTAKVSLLSSDHLAKISEVLDVKFGICKII